MMMSMEFFLVSSPIAASVIAAALLKQRQLARCINAVWSDILHVSPLSPSAICKNVEGKKTTLMRIKSLLLLLYPIKDAQTGAHNLPAAPYQWPGGNGDEAKFLHGPANSLRWSRAYGPIYRIWSGTNTEIVVSRGDDIKAIFHDSDRHLKAQNNDSGWLMGEVLGRCVGLLSQAEWSFLRTRVEVPFLHKDVLKFLPTIQNQTEAFWSELFERKFAQLPAMEAEKGATITIDAAQDTKMLPFRLVATLLYGDLSADLNHLLESLIPGRERLFAKVIKGGVGRFWWSAYLPTDANKLLKHFQSSWFAFNKKAYERAKERGCSAPIVPLWEQMECGEIDRKQLLQTLDEIMFANLDVTTGALSWLLVNIANHPSSQSHLYTELLPSVVDAPSSDTEALSTYFNATGTYLSYCISESARVRPIAAFSVPQAAPTARVVGGYRIPAGTSVTVDSYALNIRNPFWGADGATFRPERWARLRPSETRYHAWRFGFGPRNCMGKYFAEKFLRVALVLLLRNYELSIDREKEIDGAFETNPESWITHPDVRIRCRPRRSPEAA